MTSSAPPPSQIASRKHLIGFLLIGAALVALGTAQQSSANSRPAPQSQSYIFYFSAIVLDSALLYYCWAGVRKRGGNLETLSGGRWSSWRDLATDFSIALPFWIVWEGAAWALNRLVGAGTSKTVAALLPHTLGEILLWIVTCITAGICEELAFRGYLQKQIRALTGSVSAAILAQGVVFGLFHAYQGWRNVVVISVLGILFGLLAAWRGNLRANVLAHAWADIWGGWLQFVVFR